MTQIIRYLEIMYFWFLNIGYVRLLDRLAIEILSEMFLNTTEKNRIV